MSNDSYDRTPYCPLDPQDKLEGIMVWHQHYAVCHRHKLIEFIYGGGRQVYPEDTPKAIAYYEEMEARIKHYTGVKFLSIPTDQVDEAAPASEPRRFDLVCWCRIMPRILFYRMKDRIRVRILRLALALVHRASL